MNVKEIFNLAIELGMKHDVRDDVRNTVEQRIKSLGYGEDVGELENPYKDSQILEGYKFVSSVVVGVDAHAPELLTASIIGKHALDLRDEVDLVISHHPVGLGHINLHEVIEIQTHILASYGVPINIAQAVTKKRMGEVKRTTLGGNHYRPVDLARNLNLSYMCLHTPLDNLAYSYVRNAIEASKTNTVKDVIDVLLGIEEYKISHERGTGPLVLVGAEENYCGRVAVTEFTGGTEPKEDVYKYLAQAEVGTIVTMHMTEANREEAERNHINVVMAGHMASDSLGINLFLSELAKKEEKLTIISAGGLIRVER